MIINLDHFITEERPYWDELEGLLEGLDVRTGEALTFAQAKRLHYLYQRAASGLARIQTFAAEPSIRQYLEGLVSRAYGEIHESHRRAHRFRPHVWFLQSFPQAFRRRYRAFAVVLAATLLGALFGVYAVRTDDAGAKRVLLPFDHLQGNPSERVAREESAESDRLRGVKATFASELMTHNTKVSIMSMAFGMTWGLGTLVLMFYNGAVIGAVGFDYVRDGEQMFLLGWLLPHGVVEIPAILLAGQAGCVLGGALIGGATAATLRARLRDALPDVTTLIFGVAIMLIWAGIIESFLSQYHEPVIPYAAKITFGCVEFALLAAFLGFAGRGASARGLDADVA